MTKIKIFKSGREIDLPTFIDSRGLACTNSGGGKSYLLRKICEETQDKVLIIILDVEGEFKTLREQYDFLLIGDNADVSLNVKSANLLPRKILELDVSTIIDISNLKMHDRIMYVKGFLESLMELPRELWKPCIVIVDEAHLFCGQQEKQDSTHAVIDLMTRGRKRGYCGILATQRIAKLHKDACAEANNYFMGRIGLDVDMKRASEILGFTSKEQMLSLRDLEPGEFYVFGPAISKHVEKEIIGEVKTTHPKVGMDVRKNIVAPTDKIKKILQKISDLPKEQEEKLKETQDYKNKIKELEGKLRMKSVPEKNNIEVPEKVLERAKAQGFKEAEVQFSENINFYKKENSFLKKENDNLNNIMKTVGNFVQKALDIPKRADKPEPATPKLSLNAIKPIAHIKPEVKTKLQTEPKLSETYDSDVRLGLAERKIYTLLYRYPDKTFSKPQIGVFTGYSWRGGAFQNALGKLNSLGLIEKDSFNVKLKDLNPELVGEFDFSREAIIPSLGKCEKEIYGVVSEDPEREFTREEIAELTPSQYEPKGGAFNNALGKLNSLGIIEKRGNSIKLNPELLEL